MKLFENFCKLLILMLGLLVFTACSGRKIANVNKKPTVLSSNGTASNNEDGSVDVDVYIGDGQGSDSSDASDASGSSEPASGSNEPVVLTAPQFTAPTEQVNITGEDYTFTWTSADPDSFFEVKSCQEGDCASSTCNEEILLKKLDFNLRLSYHRDYYLCARSTDGGTNFSPWSMSEVVYRRSLPQDIQIIDYKFDLTMTVDSEIGKLSVANADPNSTYSFEIVPDVGDFSQFELMNSDDDPNQNNILIAKFDVTAETSYSVQIKVTSAQGDEYSKDFSFAVGLENLPPSDIELTETAVEENQGVDVVVGFLSAVDATPGDFHNYELVPIDGSEDHSSFAIEGTVLKAIADFDYETKPLYSLRIRATDKAELTYEKDFEISVTCQTGLKQVGAYCFEDDGVRDVTVFSVSFANLALANSTDAKADEFVDTKFLTQVAPGDSVSLSFDWSTYPERPENQYCPTCLVFFPYGFQRIMPDGSVEITKLGCVNAGTRAINRNETITATFDVPAGDAAKGVYRLKQFRAALQYNCDDSPLVSTPEARDLGIVIVE